MLGFLQSSLPLRPLSTRRSSSWSLLAFDFLFALSSGPSPSPPSSPPAPFSPPRVAHHHQPAAPFTVDLVKPGRPLPPASLFFPLSPNLHWPPSWTPASLARPAAFPSRPYTFLHRHDIPSRPLKASRRSVHFDNRISSLPVAFLQASLPSCLVPRPQPPCRPPSAGISLTQTGPGNASRPSFRLGGPTQATSSAMLLARPRRRLPCPSLPPPRRFDLRRQQRDLRSCRPARQASPSASHLDLQRRRRRPRSSSPSFSRQP